jgi:hypothetical protein
MDRTGQSELFQYRLPQAVSKLLASVPRQRGLPALVVQLGVPLAFLEVHALRCEPSLELTDFHGGSLPV